MFKHKKLLYGLGTIAVVAPVVTVVAVMSKTVVNRQTFYEVGKLAFRDMVANKMKTPQTKQFMDAIPKDDKTITFMFQRHTTTTINEQVSYALLSAGETYIDAAYDEYDYDSLSKINKNIKVTHTGAATYELPNGWLAVAKKAKKDGKKINLVIPSNRAAHEEGENIFRNANSLFRLADKAICLEDGASNGSASWTQNAAAGMVAGTYPLSNNFYSAVGNLQENGDYSLFGFGGSMGDMALTYLPKFDVYYTNAIKSEVSPGVKLTDLGFGNIDSGVISEQLFAHQAVADGARPFVAVRSFFAKDMIKQINDQRDGRKIYMMLGTYNVNELDDNFKDGFAKLYASGKDDFQIFWKGHPNGDREGQWVQDVFMAKGWKVDGKLIKPNKGDVIVLNPSAAAESLFDLRETITDDQEFSWDAIGCVDSRAIGFKGPFTSTVYNMPANQWDKFENIIWLSGDTELEIITKGEYQQSKNT